MLPVEIMISESQERMLLIVEKGEKTRSEKSLKNGGFTPLPSEKLRITAGWS